MRVADLIEMHKNRFWKTPDNIETNIAGAYNVG